MRQRSENDRGAGGVRRWCDGETTAAARQRESVVCLMSSRVRSVLSRPHTSALPWSSLSDVTFGRARGCCRTALIRETGDQDWGGSGRPRSGLDGREGTGEAGYEVVVRGGIASPGTSIRRLNGLFHGRRMERGRKEHCGRKGDWLIQDDITSCIAEARRSTREAAMLISVERLSDTWLGKRRRMESSVAT